MVQWCCMQLTHNNLFEQHIWDYYGAYGRHDLPWRCADAAGIFDPYRIVVSEVMLQQTQVQRVIPKFEMFIAAYPDFAALAAAPLADVLILWNGLGYNRRAKFLWQLAGEVMAKHDGILPRDNQALVRLPGIGPNTAGAILAYAFNKPVTFIETNIRTVFIHHFFADQTVVADALLEPLIADTVPRDHSREWYWALMDYGTHLKQTVGNASRASKAYTRQSTFAGSRRQIRGQVLKMLTKGSTTLDELHAHIVDERLESVVQDLTQEGFIMQIGTAYQLSA